MLRALATFAAIFAIIWLCLYEVQRRFPFVQTGADVISQVKLRYERTPHLFKKPNAAGVLFFGNSKALSGFIPDQFDAEMATAGHPTESYNLGIPGYLLFVDRLAAILRAGNVPRYILITVPWDSGEAPRNSFHPIRHDSHAMQVLFPFRHLPGDMILAVILSLQTTGRVNYYAANREIADHMLADRGYYFIHDATVFPDNRLPVNFTTAGDEPTRVDDRRATTREKEFSELLRLLDTYNVQCLFVPQYFRLSQFAAPPAENLRLKDELAPYPRVKLLGPDYIRVDNRFFSDSQHLNPDGARLYTRYIASLVEPYLR